MGTWINPKDSDGEVVPSRQYCRDHSPWCCSWRGPFIAHGPTGGLLGDTKTCQVGTQPLEDIAAAVGQTSRQLLWVLHRGDFSCGGLGGNPRLCVFSMGAAGELILPWKLWCVLSRVLYFRLPPQLSSLLSLRPLGMGHLKNPLEAPTSPINQRCGLSQSLGMLRRCDCPQLHHKAYHGTGNAVPSNTSWETAPGNI